jgi:transmembrane sensor
MGNTGSMAEIRKETAEWLIEMDANPDGWNRHEFAAWLRASPLHAAEFLDQHALWFAMSGTKAVDIDLAELRRESKNVIDWPSESSVRPIEAAQPAKASRRGWLYALAASVFVLVGALLVWGALLSPSQKFTTAIGEQRSVRLADGSILHMNTDTDIEIRFTKDSRELQLIRGEALFSVERDVKRPFRVIAGGVAFEALGTQFNVRRRTTATTISVVEGRVAVITGAPAHPAVPAIERYEANRPPPSGAVTVVGAGEQIRVATDGRVTAEAIDNVAAWRQRKLIFEDTPLSEVISEIARYNASPRIVIEDSTLSDRRLNGVFAADDTESLLQFLKHEGLSITATADTVAIGSPH